MDIKDFDPNGFKIEFRNSKGEVTQTFQKAAGVSMCKNCGSTGKHKPFWLALGKRWCGHCGGRVTQ